MNRVLLILLSCMLLINCKNKKPDVSGDETMDISDFIESFEDITLPYILADTAIARKNRDTLVISKKVLSQFVPDSIFKSEFGKTAPRYYALGKAAVKGGETYLFIKAATSAKSVGYVLAYDTENEFKAAMPFVNSSNDRNIHFEGGMDRRHSVIRNRIRSRPDGQQIYNKNVYIYNTAGTFTLILNESNETVEVKEVYNPIDTLPKKFPRSGDYVKNKKNFISFRDGSKHTQLLFFVHFEANNGDCSGELKGVADLIKPNVAHYRRADDHCVLEFNFTSTKVTVKELEACGNHRGIKCSFDATYTKVKEVKKAKPKAKK